MHQGDASILVNDNEKSFHFKIAVATGLEIWLEDSESKEQWQTKELALDDFVTNENVLAQAMMSDYAMQFAGILTSDDESARAVSEYTANGTLSLKLRLALSASSFAAKLEYHFELLPIKLEKVDLLAAHVKDLQDAVRSLKWALEEITERVAYLEE